MKQDYLSDLEVFAIIAEEQSFTRAAVRLGRSGSAVSQAMRVLEERLGVKLLNRTTRSVATTEAGERLLRRLRPALNDIEAGIEELGDYRDRPRGRVRITAHRNAAHHRILPKLSQLRRDYPDIVVELAVEDGLTDIVAAGFDAGVRNGEQLDKDMIAIRIGPDCPSVVVAGPQYLQSFPEPKSPTDLKNHNCISYRRITSGALSRWRFQKDERPLLVDVNPVFVTNDTELLVQCSLRGIGLAYVLREQAERHIASGALIPVLEDWNVTFPGSFLYYPSRRQVPPALRVVIDALRYELA